MILLIKKYRNKKNISLRQLARYTGLSYGYLNKLELNKKNTSVDSIEIIGHVLGICPKNLIGGCNNHLCNNRCYYYRSRYNDFPVMAKKEIFNFIKHIRKKYNIN